MISFILAPGRFLTQVLDVFTYNTRRDPRDTGTAIILTVGFWLTIGALVGILLGILF